MARPKKGAKGEAGAAEDRRLQGIRGMERVAGPRRPSTSARPTPAFIDRALAEWTAAGLRRDPAGTHPMRAPPCLPTTRPRPRPARRPPAANWPASSDGGPNGEPQRLRVSLENYEGHDYISVRLWQEDHARRGWWPLSGKGISIRLREAEGVAEALRRALRLAGPARPAEGHQRPQASRQGRERRPGDFGRHDPAAGRLPMGDGELPPSRYGPGSTSARGDVEAAAGTTVVATVETTSTRLDTCRQSAQVPRSAAFTLFCNGQITPRLGLYPRPCTC